MLREVIRKRLMVWLGLLFLVLTPVYYLITSWNCGVIFKFEKHQCQKTNDNFPRHKKKINYVQDPFCITSNTLLIVKHILGSQCIIMSALWPHTRGIWIISPRPRLVLLIIGMKKVPQLSPHSLLPFRQKSNMTWFLCHKMTGNEWQETIRQ